MNVRIDGCVIALSIAFVVTATNAELIEVDNEHGTGAGTVDTTQALEFLDLTLTTDMSFNDMQPLLGPNGIYNGWRHASRFEIISMFNSVGSNIPYEPGRYSIPRGPIGDVMELVGITRSIPDFAFGVAGITGDENTFLTNYTFAIDIFGNMMYADIQNMFNEQLSWDNPGYGHWLVRENTIPAPSSLSMLAIIGCGASRRRR